MSTRLSQPPTPLPQLKRGDVIRMPAGAAFGRIYLAGGAHPGTWDSFRYFGPVSTMRFDHQPTPSRRHPSRAVSYVAPARGRRAAVRYDPLATCVLEFFAFTRTIDLHATDPWFTLWQSARSLRLLDVSDSSWSTRAGGNAAISSGARGTSRAWARRIYAEYPDVDGIFFASSVVPMARSAVLFERATDALPPRPTFNAPLRHPGLRPALRRTAAYFNLNLVV